MPTPHRGESRSHYMARCVPYVLREAGTRSADHAVAKCAGMWSQHQKEGRAKVVVNARRTTRVDPTRTGFQRKRFAAAITRRFNWLKKQITALIVEEDAFGLSRANQTMTVHTRWYPLSSPERLAAFRLWLEQQVNAGVLESVTPNAPKDIWLEQYIRESYEKGAGRAFDDAMRKYEFGKGERPDFYAGSREQFLRDSFRRPASVERVRYLAERSYSDLKGVTEGMASTLHRTLMDGMIQGASPRVLGRNLNKVVDGYKNRGLTIARTETIRAHAEGQLDSLKNLGVEKVGVMVEFSTAAVGKVCQLCDDLEGVVLKIDEARNMIPRHPNCRCAWLPANVGESMKGQVRGKSKVDEVIKQSIQDENPRAKTLEEAKALSRWAGADVRIAKTRLTEFGTFRRKRTMKTRMPEVDWRQEVVADAAKRGTLEAITLPDLYEDLKKRHPSLTEDEFKTELLKLHQQGKIRMTEYTRAPADIVGKLQIPHPSKFSDPYFFVERPLKR